MGCGPQYKRPQLIRAETLIGVLKIVIIETYFLPQPQLSVPSIKVRISNQEHQTNKIPYVANRQQVNEHFTFFINSLFKGQGRTIQIAIFDKDDFIAYGAIDANPLINARKQHTDPFRIILASDKHKKFGHITLQAVFEEITPIEASFRFISATIRRKPGQNLAVRLTIGEQILQTNFREDQTEIPPIWKDEMLVFKIPTGIEQGTLQLINDRGEIVGQSRINVRQYLNSSQNTQTQVAQELFYKQNEREIDAASLKFIYILGQKASFSQTRDILKTVIRQVKNPHQFSTLSYNSRLNG